MADSTITTTTRRDKSVIQTAHAVANRRLCREHYRLTLRVASLPPASAGQFVHLCPDSYNAEDHGRSDERSRRDWVGAFRRPMLRRAFSIAGLGRSRDSVDVDVIYRVVGAATGWMETLREGDPVSLLGPLGNSFPISDRKSVSWLVAGGVGLPPMLWLAEALHKTNKRIVAFCGAQTHDLLALTLEPGAPPDASAKTATSSAKEFARCGADVVLSTDDGSLGFRGYVGSAMAAYHHQANPVAADALVVYTCGPEPMMHFVAEYCIARQIECYVCVERNMACGTGMCQSCVVPIRDPNDPAGWSYRLCCTDGPIFEARDVLWETPRRLPILECRVNGEGTEARSHGATKGRRETAKRRNSRATGFDSASLSTLQLGKYLCRMELRFFNWVRLVRALFSNASSPPSSAARRPSAEALLPAI